MFHTVWHSTVWRELQNSTSYEVPQFYYPGFNLEDTGGNASKSHQDSADR